MSWQKNLARLGILLFVLLAAGTQRLCAQVPIAVNLDGFGDWMTSAAYIDATAYFRRWGMPGEGWKEHPGLRLTADNLPLGDADAVSSLRGYPDGIYKLRYQGNARVNFIGCAGIVPGTMRTTGGVTTADVSVRHRGPEELITLQVRNVDANDPLRSLQLISPGYADASRVFRQEFVRRVRPFQALRFMDWQQTNGNPLVNWADRPRPSQFSRTGRSGVPIEEIVLLANTTRRDVWVNIPHKATDDFVRQFATHLRDHLHKDAVIRFEYSNEVWNFGMPQAKENLETARANAKLTKNDDFGRCAQHAADRLGTAARIFKEVFGDSQFAARVRPVVGGFIAVRYWGRTQIDWLREHHAGLVKELAIAPYFGVEGDIKDVDVAGATADTLFDKLDNWIDTRIATWVADHKRTADSFGLDLVAYEGGNHITWTNGINEQVKLAMQRHPRMAKTYQHLLSVWGKNGGKLFVQFGHIAPYSKFGTWGLLEEATQSGSVKWDFFLTKLLPLGDATLDGNVTWDDFVILKSHFGKTNCWWEQGDFNGDGKVDPTDLAILKKNAVTLTAEQRAELDKMCK